MNLHSWKFAANARWEEALTLAVDQPIDIDSITHWIANNSQNIALEAIFSENGMPATMFGIRITSLSKPEQVARVAALLARTHEIRMEGDFLPIARAMFPEFDLFDSPLEALNIGIVSQWYSFGPQELWTPEQQADSPLPVKELRQVAPRFLEQTANPAAIEFWYTAPTDHWYKIYVSDLHDGGYILNPAKYCAALDRLPAFTHNVR